MTAKQSVIDHIFISDRLIRPKLECGPGELEEKDSSTRDV